MKRKNLSSKEIFDVIRDKEDNIENITSRLGEHKPIVFFCSNFSSKDASVLLNECPYATSLEQIVPDWEAASGEKFSECTIIRPVIDFAVEQYLIDYRSYMMDQFKLDINNVLRVPALIIIANNDWKVSSHNCDGPPILTDAYLVDTGGIMPDSVLQNQFVYNMENANSVNGVVLDNCFYKKAGINDGYN